MSGTTVRTAGLCLLVILAGVALAGCTDDAEEEMTDPNATDNAPSDDEAEESGSQTDGPDSADEEDPPPIDLDVQTPAAWPTVGFDERRTNAYASTGSGTGEEFYRAKIDARTGAAPAVANGLIYVPWEEGPGTDASGLLGAYDVNTGEEVFTFETEEPVKAPLVAADGLVFVQTTNDGLYALDEQGETAWHNEGGDGTATITFNDGVLYIVLNGDLFAVNATTGELEWKKGLDGRTNEFVGHALVQEERILVPASSDEGDLYSLDPDTRETQWVYDGDTSSTEFGQAVSVADGTVFFGVAFSNELHAIDSQTGEADWVVDRRVEVGWRFPVLSDGNVLNQNRSVLEALDPDTGELVWETEIEAFPTRSLPGTTPPRAVVVAEGTIYAWASESGEHRVHAFDAGTGELDWTNRTHLADHAVAVDDVLFSIGKDAQSPAEIQALDAGYR